jgi:cephalosporin-C deacetylase
MQRADVLLHQRKENMPLTFDLPFEQLQDYKGINPKPADFDRFWDASLAEMRAIRPEIELVPAAFQAPGCDCFHLYFNGTQGARVHAKLLKPANIKKSGPALLMFHGYAEDSGDWVEKLPYVAQGFTVAALDCRGQAGLSEDAGGVTGNTLHGQIIRGLADAVNGKPEKLLYRQIFLDTAQLAGILMDMPEVDPTRVGAMGWSQGGALSIACAALEPRIKRLAPMYPFLSDFQRVWEMDYAIQAYKELQEYFRNFDPRHQKEEQIFTALGYIDIQNLAARVKGEVLWGIGLMDTICPPSTQFATYNKLNTEKKMLIYPDFEHETLPGFADLRFEFFMGL